jgi:hypothetical protein
MFQNLLQRPDPSLAVQMKSPSLEVSNSEIGSVLLEWLYLARAPAVVRAHAAVHFPVSLRCKAKRLSDAHASHKRVLSDTTYLSISFRKSAPPQNRQHNVLIGNSKP